MPSKGSESLHGRIYRNGLVLLKMPRHPVEGVFECTRGEASGSARRKPSAHALVQQDRHAHIGSRKLRGSYVPSQPSRVRACLSNKRLDTRCVHPCSSYRACFPGCRQPGLAGYGARVPIRGRVSTFRGSRRESLCSPLRAGQRCRPSRWKRLKRRSHPACTASRRAVSGPDRLS